jgi:cytochrome c553
MLGTSLGRLGAILGAMLLVLLLGNAPARAQTGKELFVSKGCPACHGPEGRKTFVATYPKLAGQPAPFLSMQLRAFKTQERKGGQAILMWGMAAQLSDPEIEKISDYLSKLP